MAIKTDPLALATRGIIKEGGTTDPLGVASFGVVVLTGAPPVGGETEGRRRRTYFTYLGRGRLGR